MSVILGYKTSEKIILAADNRCVNKSGDVVSNKIRKIVSVNSHLAVAFCGNMVIQIMFKKKINSLSKGKNNYYVDDALFWLKEIFLFFKNSEKTFNKQVASMPSNFIVAGLNDNLQMFLCSVLFIDDEISMCVSDSFLFTPPHVSFEKYAHKYVAYLNNNTKNCMKKIVKEISMESNAVSKTGDIWTYSCTNNKSKIKHFY
ncbi:hypothetical protein AALB39_04120 [Lachnospiraceae bacterium 54-53]